MTVNWVASGGSSMKSLHYSTAIDAPRAKVWEIMLGPKTYQEWTGAAWPGGSYEGDWSEGSEMRFEGEEGGGTAARITSVRPNESISAEHFAVIKEDGSPATESDMAKGWIGTTESYTFNNCNGGTEVVVDMNVPPDWVSMFDEGWPKALQALKELVEKS